jgi:aryl-alcohol dehydrogenase-like predicted oxidoreductase
MQTTLPTRPFGTTDMSITRVGFGAWAIGGGEWTFGWGPQDDEASVAAIRHSVESGINWIDTAAVYGLGHSEDVVATALRDLPGNDRPLLFTKGGLVWGDDRMPTRVAAPDSLRREVDASLQRLGVERIDLYQLHWPPEDGTTIEEYWPVFVELKQQGKVRAIGLSNHDVPQLDAAEAIGHVDSLQPLFNPISRAAAADVIPWCAKHDTGVIPYSPMASGLLTGSWTEERSASLDPTDWRTKTPAFKGEALRDALTLADGLRPIAERHGVSVGTVAIAWTLAFDGVTGSIVGARSPEQIDGWIAAATLELDAEDLAAASVAIKTSASGAGPIEP